MNNLKVINDTNSPNKSFKYVTPASWFHRTFNVPLNKNVRLTGQPSVAALT